MLKVIGARLLLGKEITDIEKDKARINCKVFGWHWSYYNELIISSIYRLKRYVAMYAYMRYCVLRGNGNQHSRNSEQTMNTLSI